MFLAELRAAIPAGARELLEVDGAMPAAAPGSLDVVVLTAPLDTLPDPLAVLRSIRAALRPDGSVVCGVRNLTDQAALVQLLRGDPQEAPRGVVQPDAHAVHGFATALKLLLEAGYSPEIVDAPGPPVDPELLDAAKPLLEHLRVNLERAARHLGAERYVLVGRPIADLDEGPYDGPPLTFAACINDDLQLHHNLLASPCFADGHPHEVLLYRGMSSAAEGLNRGIQEASHDIVVLVQQDIYLPSWWPARLVQQWSAARADGDPALGGPVGVRYREGGRTNVGHAVDRDRLFHTPHALPAEVDGLDELLLVVPRNVEERLDPALGWHLYATDLSLQAHANGHRIVALDIPCHHNSLLAGLDGGYHHAESVLAAKWPRELPIVTNSTTIDEDPRDVRAAALEEALAGLEDLRVAVADLEAALALSGEAVTRAGAGRGLTASRKRSQPCCQKRFCKLRMPPRATASSAASSASVSAHPRLPAFCAA
jgi:hypothetical protein